MCSRSKRESPGMYQVEVQISTDSRFSRVRLLVLIKDDKYVGWENLMALKVIILLLFTYIILNDIENFMFTNKLKLNPDKTEFILIGSPKNRKKQLFPHFPINILENQVSQAQSVKNLGVVFDSNFNFSNHVSQVIKSTRVHARDLYRIRPLLDLNTSVLLANVLVSSRLDYCNSLFLSLTDFEFRRLQQVQNSLCRVVTRSSKSSHITPLN